MKRMTIALAVFALVAGAAFGQCPAANSSDTDMAQARPHRMGAGPGSMQGPRQMPMMKNMMSGGAAALAVYEGNIYVVDGKVLKKLTSDMKEIKSIELDIACPMHSQKMQGKARPGAKAGARGQMQGQRPRQGTRGKMMRGQRGAGMRQGMMRGQRGAGMQQGMMHRGMRGGCGGLQIAADSTGVYVLHHGTLTRYDHDLNRVATKEVLKRPKMMQQDMRQQGPRQGMQGRPHRGQMQGQRPQQHMQGRHMGGMRQGRGGQHAPIAQRRSIKNGEVTLGYLPTELTTGQVDLRIHVLDINGEYDADAEVSAFLYPEGSTGTGKTLNLQSHRDGRFLAMANISNPGTWELGVRVSRPGTEDVKVYFPLQVSQ